MAGREDRYYRTLLTVEILSDHPVDFADLQDVHDAITIGDCSGDWNVTSVEEVDAAQMARLLEEQGSDPGFLITDWADEEDADEDVSPPPAP